MNCPNCKKDNEWVNYECLNYTKTVSVFNAALDSLSPALDFLKRHKIENKSTSFKCSCGVLKHQDDPKEWFSFKLSASNALIWKDGKCFLYTISALDKATHIELSSDMTVSKFNALKIFI